MIIIGNKLGETFKYRITARKRLVLSVSKIRKYTMTINQVFNRLLGMAIVFILSTVIVVPLLVISESSELPPTEPGGGGSNCGYCKIWEPRYYCRPCSEECGVGSPDYDECYELCCDTKPEFPCGECTVLTIMDRVCEYQCNDCQVCAGDNQYDAVCVDKCKSDEHCWAGSCYKYCGGTKPTLGVTYGDYEYLVSNPPSNTNWHHVDSTPLSACEWTCSPGYTFEDGACILSGCGDFGSIAVSGREICRTITGVKGGFADTGCPSKEYAYFTNVGDNVNLYCRDTCGGSKCGCSGFLCSGCTPGSRVPYQNCHAKCNEINGNCDTECVSAEDCYPKNGVETAAHQAGCVYESEGTSCTVDSDGSAGECNDKGQCIPVVTTKDCTGTPPTGAGVLIFSSTYQSNAAPATTSWNYVDFTPTVACQWSCSENYVKSGNGCASDRKACTGTTPNGSGVILGASTYSSTSAPSITFWNYVDSNSLLACQWTCAEGYTRSGNGCTAESEEKTCGGTPPSGAGVLLGSATYASDLPPANTNWNYVTSTTLSACQWTCDVGYTRNGNTCEAESAEECTSGVCCDTTIGKFRPSGYQCRASAGVCDVAEYCTGSSNLCPADSFKSRSEICSTGSWSCSGNKDTTAPDSCQRIRNVQYCSGSRASCDGVTATQTENAPSGQVCHNGNFVKGSSTYYAFDSDYNRCSKPNSPETGFGGAIVKDVYACNGANGRGRDVGDVSRLCSSYGSGYGCCYDAGSEAFCDIFGNQAYNYWDFGTPDQTSYDYCVSLSGTRQVKDCKDDGGCKSEFQAKIDTGHSQAFYLCTDEFDCKRSCYAQPCFAGQYTCTDNYVDGTSVTYYCVNTTKSKFQSSFVFNPAGSNDNQRYCNENEYVTAAGECRIKPREPMGLCFLQEKCGKTGIDALWDTSPDCGGNKRSYCNFSSGALVLNMPDSVLKIAPEVDKSKIKGQGSFPHAGRVFGYNYVVYEPDADNSSAIGFSKLAKFNNDGTREESELYWDTCGDDGNVLERYSDPSFSTDSSSVFSKQYNCKCLNIDYPNYNLAICKTPPDLGNTPRKVITYTPSGKVHEKEEHDSQDAPPQSAPSQATDSLASPTSTADGATGSTGASAPTSEEDDEASEPTDTSGTVLTQVEWCTDKTILGECSATKIGYKCEDLKLVPKCTECGCPNFYICNTRTNECCRTLFGFTFGCI